MSYYNRNTQQYINQYKNMQDQNQQLLQPSSQAQRSSQLLPNTNTNTNINANPNANVNSNANPDNNNNNGQAHSQHIRNVRMKKQLQFLTNYNYSIQHIQQDSVHNIQQHTLITIYNLFNNNNNKNNNVSMNSNNNNDNSDNISLGNMMQDSLQAKAELTIQLPKQYPFRSPKFTYNNTSNNNNNSNNNNKISLTIAQLIDQWSPRYKIMEMIQLIKKRIQQRQQLQHNIGHNPIYAMFKPVQNVYLWIAVAFMVRVIVGLGGYSGKGDWPNLGDFQAHRNWMSITVNRPITQWYTEYSEQPWWRIDYPPVAAYISYILGMICAKIQPASMQLQAGYQSAALTSFMRTSVLLIDLIFLLPPVILTQRILQSSLYYRNYPLYLSSFLLIYILKPDTILIDHGHFQYNSLTLGMILWAFYFMVTGRRYLACVVYVIAVNCKLMAVYYSLAFLAGLIAVTIRKYGKHRKNTIITQCLIYACIVIITMLLIWIPWLTKYQNFKTVLQAIFPVHRGLYQLKVPNFWCISDILLKYQSWISKPVLTLICALLCLIFSLPSMLAIILNPSPKILTISFTCIALTFFMFSYHVHQKSILLPLLVLPFTSQFVGGRVVVAGVVGGLAGMYHLLKEDGQVLQYFVLLIVYIVFAQLYYQCESVFYRVYHPSAHTYIHQPHSHTQPIISPLSSIAVSQQTPKYLFSIILYLPLLLLHIGQFLLKPPTSLPYLWHLLFAYYGFMINVVLLAVFNWVAICQIKDRLITSKKNQ